MKLESTMSRLRFLPVHLIDVEGGVVIKRGALETHIRGEHAGEIVRFLIGTFTEAGEIRDNVVAALPAAHRAAVERLLDDLVERRLLVRADAPEAAGAGAEREIDVFYWNAGTSTAAVMEKVNETSVTIIGVNAVSRQLVTALRSGGFENVEVVDFLRLRNERYFSGEGSINDDWREAPPLAYDRWADEFDPQSCGTLVTTSDNGGLHWMREWNELCIENGVRFYPVVLQNMVGYAGPVVVPGETACFECFRARQNSHMADAELSRSVERAAIAGASVNAFHPSMASILGDVAAIELLKVHGGAVAPPQHATVLEVRLLEPSITRHSVLRVPRCPVCSPLRRSAPVSIDRSTFLAGNRSEA